MSISSEPTTRSCGAPVKTGLVTAEGIAVTEGLNGTERVVLRAGGFLAPGDKVVPRTAKPAPTASAPPAATS